MATVLDCGSENKSAAKFKTQLLHGGYDVQLPLLKRWFDSPEKANLFSYCHEIGV